MIQKKIQSLFVCGLMMLCISCDHSSKLVPVKSGEKWGFINSKGKYEINPQFDDADCFSEGLALITAPNGEKTFIEENGIYKMAAQYVDATPFSNGLAFAVDNEGYLICIDKTGKKKFTLNDVKWVMAFSERFAMFGVEDREGILKVGFYNTSGKRAIQPQYKMAHVFSERLAAVKMDDKWGFVDTSGKLAIAPQFDSVSDFKNGRAVFYLAKSAGYIDHKGKIIINPQFERAENFHEGMAVVSSGKQSGYIDSKGKFAINPQFEEALAFSDGLAAVRMDKKWGYVNKKGKMLISPQFDEAKPFDNNVALVKFSGRWALINKKGEYVVNPQFSDVQVNDQTPKVIYSSYYDASEFVGRFFKKAGKSTFDGFDVNSTLKKVMYSPLYRNLHEGNKYMAYADKRQKFSDEISLKTVMFHFVGYISETKTRNEWVTDNDDYYYYHRYKEYSVPKKYTCYYDEKLAVIEYPFVLSGEAKGKSLAIANALKAEIKDFYGVEFEEDGKSGFYVAYPSRNGNPGFGIRCGNERLSLLVGFQGDKLRELLNKDEADFQTKGEQIFLNCIEPVSAKSGRYEEDAY